MNTSSMILLVLDFSKPDNKIERQIAEEVKGFIKVRGSEHLYILQNKWDENKDEIKIEKLQAEFARKYNIDNPNLKDRMFAVSALYAFTAISFQQAPKDKNSPEFQEAGKRLLKLLNPTKRHQDKAIQRMLEESDIKQLEKDSKELWTESLFIDFLENVIDSLIQEVVPRSILSELKYSNNCLEAFQQNIDAKLKIYKERLINNGEKLITKIGKMTNYENNLKEQKTNFLEEIKTAYNLTITEIKECINGLQDKVDKMKKSTPSCFQNLKPDNYHEHQEKIDSFEKNGNLEEISACDIDELYKCLLCKLNDKEIKSFEFPQETEANENNEKIKDVINDMLYDLINVINKILTDKIKKQDEEFRNKLQKIENSYSEFIKKEVYENNDPQDISYIIPALEAYKDDPKNPIKVFIINIESNKIGALKKIKNFLKRIYFKYLLEKDTISPLRDSYKIQMKNYFIEIYEYMIDDLKIWEKKIDEFRALFSGVSGTHLDLLEGDLQQQKSSIEKAQKEENAAEVIKKLEDLKSSKESEIKLMKDEIKKHKQYTEQVLPSRTAK